MPVNGLLVNFSQEVIVDNDKVSQLESIEGVEVGSIIGHSLPILVDCQSSKESKLRHREIEMLDDVVSVDVIFASVE